MDVEQRNERTYSQEDKGSHNGFLPYPLISQSANETSSLNNFAETNEGTLSIDERDTKNMNHTRAFPQEPIRSSTAELRMDQLHPSFLSQKNPESSHQYQSIEGDILVERRSMANSDTPMMNADLQLHKTSVFSVGTPYAPSDNYFDQSVIESEGENQKLHGEDYLEWHNRKKSGWEESLRNASPPSMGEAIRVFSQIYLQDCSQEDKDSSNSFNFIKVFVDDWWQRAHAEGPASQDRIQSVQQIEIEKDPTSSLETATLEDSQDALTQQMDDNVPRNADSTTPKTESNQLQKGKVDGATVAKAQESFKSIMDTLTNEKEIVTFLIWVEETLNSGYNATIFGGTPGRKPGSTNAAKKAPQPKKQPYLKKPKKFKLGALDAKSLLENPESILLHVNMKDIINFNSFSSLSPEEKDALLSYLPSVDKVDVKSLQDMFASSAFTTNFSTYQSMLENGDFDSSTDDYRRYLQGKRKREQTVQPWKAKFYEEYWGQKAQRKTENEFDSVSPISFVEIARQQEGPIQPDLAVQQDATSKSRKRPFEKDQDEVKPVKTPRKRRNKGQSEIITPPPTVEATMEHNSEVLPEVNTGDVVPLPLPDKEVVAEQPAEHEEKIKSPSKKSGSSGNSFRECAYTILKREGRPLSASTIVKYGLKEGMIHTSGKTPQNTLASVLYCEMKKDPNCVFTKVAPMTFGLKEFGLPEMTEDADRSSKPKSRKRKKKGSTAATPSTTTE